MRAGLTMRQAETLRFIEAFIVEHGFSPSYVEIAAATGIKHRSGVHRIVYELRERGVVTLLPDRARSISLVSEAA